MADVTLFLIYSKICILRESVIINYDQHNGEEVLNSIRMKRFVPPESLSGSILSDFLD